MNAYSELRTRGFQSRRVALAIRLLAAIWAVVMVLFFLTAPGVMTSTVAVIGIFAVSFPTLLLAEVFEDRAERYFMKATATRTLLGTIVPSEKSSQI